MTLARERAAFAHERLRFARTRPSSMERASGQQRCAADTRLSTNNHRLRTGKSHTYFFLQKMEKRRNLSRAKCLLVAGAPGAPTPPAHDERRVLCEHPTVLGSGRFDGVGGSGWEKATDARKMCLGRKKRSELTRNHAAGWTQLRTPRHGGGLGATSRARLAGGCPQPTPFNAHCATGRTKKTDGKKSVERGKRVGVLGVYNAAHWIDLRLRRSVRVCMVTQHRPFTECCHLNSRRYRQLPHLEVY